MSPWITSPQIAEAWRVGGEAVATGICWPATQRLPHLIPTEQAFRAEHFYVEPVVAWRAWRVLDRRGPTLQSVTYRWPWPIRKPMRAHCVHQLRGFATEPHAAPDLGHRCGIYAVFSRENAEAWSHRNEQGDAPYVIGTVKLWGKVLAFTEGWIAEYAYPEALIRDNAEVDELADRYGLGLLDP